MRRKWKKGFLWVWCPEKCPEISIFFCPENKNFVCPGLCAGLQIPSACPSTDYDLRSAATSAVVCNLESGTYVTAKQNQNYSPCSKYFVIKNSQSWIRIHNCNFLSMRDLQSVHRSKIYCGSWSAIRTSLIGTAYYVLYCEGNSTVTVRLSWEYSFCCYDTWADYWFDANSCMPL